MGRFPCATDSQWMLRVIPTEDLPNCHLDRFFLLSFPFRAFGAPVEMTKAAKTLLRYQSNKFRYKDDGTNHNCGDRRAKYSCGGSVFGVASGLVVFAVGVDIDQMFK